MQALLEAGPTGGTSQHEEKKYVFYLESTDELNRSLEKQGNRTFLKLPDGQKWELKEGDLIITSKDGRFTVMRGTSPEVISDLLNKGHRLYLYHQGGIYKLNDRSSSNAELVWENGKISPITQGKRNEEAYQKYREGERESYKTTEELYKSLNSNQRLEIFKAARYISIGKKQLNDPAFETLANHIKEMRNRGMREKEILEQYFGKGHGEVLYDLYNQQKGLFRDLDFSKWAAAILYLTQNPEALKNISDSQKPPEKQTEVQPPASSQQNKPISTSNTEQQSQNTSADFSVSGSGNDETQSSKTGDSFAEDQVLRLRIGETGYIDVNDKKVKFIAGRDSNGIYLDLQLPNDPRKHRFYVRMKPQPNIDGLEETPFGLKVNPTTGELNFEPIGPGTRGEYHLIVANQIDLENGEKGITISLQKINL